MRCCCGDAPQRRCTRAEAMASVTAPPCRRAPLCARALRACCSTSACPTARPGAARRAAPGGTIPVIVLTARDSVGDGRRSRPRRRRLSGQAVRPGRARGTAPGDRRRTRAGAPTRSGWTLRLDPPPDGLARRARGVAHHHRVRPARLPGAQPAKCSVASGSARRSGTPTTIPPRTSSTSTSPACGARSTDPTTVAAPHGAGCRLPARPAGTR